MYSDTDIPPEQLGGAPVTMPYGTRGVRQAEKIFVVGPAGSGKTELARLLGGHLRMHRAEPVLIGECGEVLIGRLARIEQARAVDRGCSVTVESAGNYIRSVKQYFRQSLRELGDQLTELDASLLITSLAGCSIVCGVRREREVRGYYGAPVEETVEALGDRARGHRHAWIYVERGGVPVKDSFQTEFFKAFCQYTVVNNCDISVLERAAAGLAQQLA